MRYVLPELRYKYVYLPRGQVPGPSTATVQNIACRLHNDNVVKCLSSSHDLLVSYTGTECY